MSKPSRLTLAEARKQGKLDEFIAERENEATGDLDAFDQTVEAMAGRSSEAPKASARDCPDD
jgi:hypothetical protein